MDVCTSGWIDGWMCAQVGGLMGGLVHEWVD